MRTNPISNNGPERIPRIHQIYLKAWEMLSMGKEKSMSETDRMMKNIKELGCVLHDGTNANTHVTFKMDDQCGWEATAGVDIEGPKGTNGTSYRAQCHTHIISPWADDMSQEAFKSLGAHVVKQARNEIERMNAAIEGIKQKRQQLERAIDKFTYSRRDAPPRRVEHEPIPQASSFHIVTVYAVRGVGGTMYDALFNDVFQATDFVNKNVGYIVEKVSMVVDERHGRGFVLADHPPYDLSFVEKEKSSGGCCGTEAGCCGKSKPTCPCSG